MSSTVLSGLEVIKILKREDLLQYDKRLTCYARKSWENGLTKITVPLHKELKKGTLMKIIKDSGLAPEEFEQYK